MLAGQGLPVATVDPPAPATPRAGGAPELPAALGWAASGLMWLTGPPGRAPLVPDGPVLARAEAAAWLFTALSRQLGRAVWPDVATLLGGRAALLGLHRRGDWSANGSCPGCCRLRMAGSPSTSRAPTPWTPSSARSGTRSDWSRPTRACILSSRRGRP